MRWPLVHMRVWDSIGRPREVMLFLKIHLRVRYVNELLDSQVRLTRSDAMSRHRGLSRCNFDA